MGHSGLWGMEGIFNRLINKATLKTKKTKQHFLLPAQPFSALLKSVKAHLCTFI